MRGAREAETSRSQVHAWARYFFSFLPSFPPSLITLLWQPTYRNVKPSCYARRNVILVSSFIIVTCSSLKAALQSIIACKRKRGYGNFADNCRPCKPSIKYPSLALNNAIPCTSFPSYYYL